MTTHQDDDQDLYPEIIMETSEESSAKGSGEGIFFGDPSDYARLKIFMQRASRKTGSAVTLDAATGKIRFDFPGDRRPVRLPSHQFFKHFGKKEPALLRVVR